MRRTEAGAARVSEAQILMLESLLRLQRPLELEISPDGTRLALTVAPVAKDGGRGMETPLWLGDVDGDLTRIREVGGTNGLPRFSPDGAQLAFASDDGHAGRMSLRVYGRREIDSIAGSVEEIRWSVDNRSLLVLAADLGSDRAGIQTATKIQEKGADENDPKVVRPAQYWRRLFLVDAESGKTREVTPDGVNVFEFDWGGQKVAAVCTEEPSEGAWYDAWLGLIDIEARTAERVHTPTWQLQCPRISPNGRVAWIEGVASDRTTVTGSAHVLGIGSLAPELDVTWLSFADDETLWYAGWSRSGSMFGRLGLDGSAEELFSGNVLIGPRNQPRVSPSADGARIATVLETTDQPPEVVLFENGAATALTSLNAQLEGRLHTAEWRMYTWESFDGLEIDGLLALPSRHDDGPLPLVVCVHGGPTLRWSWMVLPQQLLLAQEGYAVLLPNIRGSVGRGQEFARANLGDMGGADLQDILAGLDSLVSDGIIDNERIAITGISYGGFMSAWAVTQCDRFAAAIPCAAITNWLSFHLTTNIGRWDPLYMVADPFDPHGEYPKRSPVYGAHNCTTPTLLLHGEDDLCTPLPQAVEFYNALVEAGCETELVVYPREGHGWLELEHQIDAWSRMCDWLTVHCKGPSGARAGDGCAA